MKRVSSEQTLSLCPGRERGGADISKSKFGKCTHRVMVISRNFTVLASGVNFASNFAKSSLGARADALRPGLAEGGTTGAGTD